MSFEQIKNEKEQTREEIKSILETALEKERRVNLVIMNSAGKPVYTPDLIVIEFEGDNLYLSYICEDGEIGEEIPLRLSRIKKAELINE